MRENPIGVRDAWCLPSKVVCYRFGQAIQAGVLILADVTIRSAVEPDAAEIAAIHTASWRDAYAGILAPEFLNGDIEGNRLALWSRRLGERPSAQLVDVAQDSTGAMVAFACSFADADPRWGSLVDNLHVLPRCRGQGVGERLL